MYAQGTDIRAHGFGYGRRDGRYQFAPVEDGRRGRGGWTFGGGELRHCLHSAAVPLDLADDLHDEDEYDQLHEQGGGDPGYDLLHVYLLKVYFRA